MDIKNMNIWKTYNKAIDNPSINKIDSTRLSQFEESGYRLKNYGDYIMIEKLGSQHVTTCTSIDEAEVIINLALQLEKHGVINMTPNPRKHILGKAESLTGR